MNRTKMMFLFMILIMFFSPIHAFAAEAERNIYIGDIIELKISSQELTEEVIREKFKEFEIVGIVEGSDHFIVKLRTFETGEKKVVLGDKEIVVVVKSTLQEIQSEGPMEGGLEPAAPAPTVPWLYIFIALLAVTGVTGFVSLRGRFAIKNKVRLDPYHHFISRSNDLLYEDSEFFVKLTCYFKEYVQAVYHIRIKGMTSSEMLYTIDKLPRLQDVKKELGDWLRECDFFKFTGTVASRVRKQEMQRRLAELAGRIKTANQAVVRAPQGAGNRAVGRAPQGAAKGTEKGAAS